MKLKPTMTNLGMIIDSIGYSNFNPKLLQNPDINKETIFAIILHLVKFYLDVPQINLDFINPDASHVINTQQHSKSIEFANQYLLVSNFLSKIGINFNFSHYLNLTKQIMQQTIVRLLEYGYYKSGILTKCQNSVNKYKKAVKKLQQQNKQVQQLQQQYFRLVNKKQDETPEYLKSLQFIKNTQQSIETIRTKRKQTVNHKSQLQSQLNALIKQQQTKQLYLAKINVQKQRSKKSIIQNPQQIKHTRNTLYSEYLVIANRNKQQSKHKELKIKIAEQKFKQIKKSLIDILTLENNNLDTSKQIFTIKKMYEQKQQTFITNVNNSSRLNEQIIKVQEIYFGLQESFKKVTTQLQSQKSKVQMFKSAVTNQTITQQSLQKMLKQISQIKKIHKQEQVNLRLKIDQSFYFFRTKISELQFKSERYLSRKTNNIMHIYDSS